MAFWKRFFRFWPIFSVNLCMFGIRKHTVLPSSFLSLPWQRDVKCRISFDHFQHGSIFFISSFAHIHNATLQGVCCCFLIQCSTTDMKMESWFLLPLPRDVILRDMHKRSAYTFYHSRGWKTLRFNTLVRCRLWYHFSDFSLYFRFSWSEMLSNSDFTFKTFPQ